MTFDLAKAQFSNNFSDGLRVEISIDCGETFTTIYEKDGMDLSTISNFATSNWTPASPGNWRNEQVDLADYLGNIALFRFININGYGNSTFIDNINLEGVLSTQTNESNPFVIYPNPASNEVFLRFQNTPESDLEVTITNTIGQIVFKSNSLSLDGNNSVVLNLTNYSSGLYFISIKQSSVTQIKKLIVK